MSKPKVFLAGGDGIDWALDEGLRLLQQALKGTVEVTHLEHCEAVHSVWWEPLLAFPGDQLVGKRIICLVSGEPYRYMALPRFRHAVALVGCWIAQTHQAARQLSQVAIPNAFIPYVIDASTFRRIPPDDPQVAALRTQWQIPEGRYLIGNFHRDTEGFDLHSPKWVKGPDIFAEIVRALCKRGYPVHVVLAGPRRHWLRAELSRLGIPFTFIGKPCETDDLGINLLPRRTLNVLYNLIDLYVVSSRSEGGPLSILEATAARCKVVSTPVGLAEEVLDPACLYASPVDAVELIARDIQENLLSATVDKSYERVHRHHRPEAVAPLFRDLYGKLDRIRPYSGETDPTPSRKPMTWTSRVSRVLRRMAPAREREQLRVGLWHRFVDPPYGGGNHFMRGLRKALRKRGTDVVENRLRWDVDAYLLNSIHFDVDRFLNFSRTRSLRVVHRIDGPIHLIRGFDREKDELCFGLNAQVAAATVLQSAWTYQRIVEMDYHPVNPVIIHNAADPDIFHPRDRITFDPARKVRLISTSWSDNPRKGGAIYKWLEKRLDWKRFEYTFVGRCSERFDRIRQVPAVISEELAAILRQHDIYITASANDPCSNALIEALACGLPALYLNDGGHPELVGFGGLPFKNVEDIIPQLEIMVDNYEMFQRLIVVPNLHDVAEKYAALLLEVAE